MNLPSLLPDQQVADPAAQTCADGSVNGASDGSSVNESTDGSAQTIAGESEPD